MLSISLRRSRRPIVVGGPGFAVLPVWLRCRPLLRTPATCFGTSHGRLLPFHAAAGAPCASLDGEGRTRTRIALQVKDRQVLREATPQTCEPTRGDDRD